jgi:hypothetical protein
MMPASPRGSATVAWEQNGSLYTPPGVDAHVRHSVLLARLFQCAGASQVQASNGAHDPLDNTLALKPQRHALEDFDLAASDLLCMLKHKQRFSNACTPSAAAADAASRTEDEGEDSDEDSDDNDFQDKTTLNVGLPALNQARDMEEDMEMSVADLLLSLASRAPPRPPGLPVVPLRHRPH